MLPSQLQAKKYDFIGYERCDALYADAVSSRAAWRNSMSNDALSAMDKTLLAMRLKDWKPSDGVKRAKDKQYCYVFNEKPPGNTNTTNKTLLQDPLIANLNCNPGDVRKLGNVDFITNIFPDYTNDNPHTDREVYQKCVFEIDPKKVNAQKLNEFWMSLANNECQNYVDAASNDARNLANELRDTIRRQNDTKALLNRTKTNKIKIQKYQESYKRCEADRNTINNNLNKTIAKKELDYDCIWKGDSTKCPADISDFGKEERLQSDITAINETITRESENKRSLLNTMTKLEADNLNLITSSNDLSSSINFLKSFESNCVNVETVKLKQDTDAMLKEINDLVTQRETLTRTIDESRQRIYLMENDYNQQVAQIKAYTEAHIPWVKQSLNWCENEQGPTLRARIVEWRKLTETYRTDYDKCEKDVIRLNIEAQLMLQYLEYLHHLLSNKHAEWNWRQTAQVDQLRNDIHANGQWLLSTSDGVCSSSDGITREIYLTTDWLNRISASQNVSPQWCADPNNAAQLYRCCPPPAPAPVTTGTCAYIKSIDWTDRSDFGEIKVEDGFIKIHGKGDSNFRRFYNEFTSISPTHIRFVNGADNNKSNLIKLAYVVSYKPNNETIHEWGIFEQNQPFIDPQTLRHGPWTHIDLFKCTGDNMNKLLVEWRD